MGGDQEVPDGVRRARIHKSVKIIPSRAFYHRTNLIYVEFHDEIEIIEEYAFLWCTSLLGPIKLLGVKIVKSRAFISCIALTDVEFGDMLETIEESAFFHCSSLRSLTVPSVRTIGSQAFGECYELSDVEFGEDLETIQAGAFEKCLKLKRIILPLKDNMIEDYVFRNCPKLATVDLVEGIHNTIASLHMESWRNEMMNKINRIKQVLPITASLYKTDQIQLWMRTVIQQLNYYKTEHYKILKEATTLLELALWKANLDDNKGRLAREGERTRRESQKRTRKEIFVTSGASTVIKNVLPFLVLKS